MKDQKYFGSLAATEGATAFANPAPDAASHDENEMEMCPWCDGMGADVDAEQVQTGAHSSSWVGSVSKCDGCDGTGRIRSVRKGRFELRVMGASISLTDDHGNGFSFPVSELSVLAAVIAKAGGRS